MSSIDYDQKLINAIYNRNLDEIRISLNNGADVNTQKIYQYNTERNTPLILASQSSREDYPIVELLIRAGADVNKKNVFGETALIRAAGNGYPESVKLLLQAGADINATYCGLTPLMLADEHGHKEIVNILHTHAQKKAALSCISFQQRANPNDKNIFKVCDSPSVFFSSRDRSIKSVNNQNQDAEIKINSYQIH